jgi:hypothetical protein
MHRIRGCTIEIVNGELLRESHTQTGWQLPEKVLYY